MTSQPVPPPLRASGRAAVPGPFAGVTEPDSRDVSTGTMGLVAILIVGAAVSVALGVYGRLHDPTGIAVSLAGFSSPQTVKVWLASAATLFALVQVVSALAMFGRLPGVTAPAWTGLVHRWSGRVAFLLTVPVAVHCLYALGFQSASARVLAHSLLGTAFFGAFTMKMLVLPRRGVPGWVLPVVGSVVFTVLVGLWLTSSLWFFTTFGVHR